MTPALAAVVGATALRLLIPAASVAPASTATSTTTPPSAEVTAEASAIDIAVVGNSADLARVRALLRPRPAGAAGIRWRRLDGFDPREILRTGLEREARIQTIRCWIDLTDRRHAHLYFAGRAGARFLIRDVALSGRFDELDLTSLAEVIDSSLTAVLEDSLAGITRAEAESLLSPRPEVPARRPEPAPVVTASSPPPAVPSNWTGGSASAGVFYAAQTFAAELPLVSGPGLVVSLPVAETHGSGEIALWLSGQYQIPASASGELASVRLETIATRAGLLGLWHLGGRHLGGPRRSRWGIEVRLGGGADTIHLIPRPGTRDGSAALTPARWSTSAAFTGAAGLVAGFGESDRIRLGVRLFADLLPIAAHYDVAVDGQAMAVVVPSRLRPGLAAELTVMLGRARRSD